MLLWLIIYLWTHSYLILCTRHTYKVTLLHLLSDDFQTPGFSSMDGTRKGIGKWCKSSTAPASASVNSNRGSLISVGPDGRGGKVQNSEGAWPIPSQFSKFLFHVCDTTEATQSLIINHSSAISFGLCRIPSLKHCGQRRRRLEAKVANLR